MRPLPEPKIALGTTPPAATPSPAGSAPAPVPAGTPAPDSPLPPDRPLKPIGPARMKALREAIRSGRYPSEDVVRAGLERMIRRARSKDA